MYDANFGPDAGGGAIAVYADGATAASDVTLVSFAGTTEDVECSGRGLCDRDSGVCVCFPGYASSDGVGGFAERLVSNLTSVAAGLSAGAKLGKTVLKRTVTKEVQTITTAAGSGGESKRRHASVDHALGRALGEPLGGAAGERLSLLVGQTLAPRFAPAAAVPRVADPPRRAAAPLLSAATSTDLKRRDSTAGSRLLALLSRAAIAAPPRRRRGITARYC